jgi:hypothetical protein
MTIATFEGIVEHGQIHLKTLVRLPEKSKVYVVVPGLQVEQTVHIASPRLAHPEQIEDFEMTIIEDESRDSI